MIWNECEWIKIINQNYSRRKPAEAIGGVKILPFLVKKRRVGQPRFNYGYRRRDG